MSPASLPSVMTVDEFFDWPTPDGSHRWELVDGIAVAMASLRSPWLDPGRSVAPDR
jgi:hypothetical protein